MQKIVINTCYGGFSLSDEAFTLYKELKRNVHRRPKGWDHDIPRDDKELVQVVETLGDKANSGFSNLKIVKVPDGIKWLISEYYGLEHVAENYRIWT